MSDRSLILTAHYFNIISYGKKEAIDCRWPNVVIHRRLSHKLNAFKGRCVGMLRVKVLDWIRELILRIINLRWFEILNKKYGFQLHLCGCLKVHCDNHLTHHMSFRYLLRCMLNVTMNLAKWMKLTFFLFFLPYAWNSLVEFWIWQYFKQVMSLDWEIFLT